MSILSVVQDAAVLSLGLERPSVLFTNTSRTWVEMQALVNECARQILEDYPWSALKKVATITGDGTATAFSLPSDYEQMVNDANLWGTSVTYYPAQQVLDFNQWLQLQSYSIETWEQRWSVFGGNLNLMPALPAGENLVYGYISNNIVSGGKTAFTADSDTFVLDERLLKLCVIYNWKAYKGQDYAGDLQKYEEAMGQAKFKDPGARQTITTGRRYRWPTGQSFP